MRGARTLLVLVVVLAGLGAYIYFVQSKKPAEGDLPSTPKVFQVASDAIEDLTIKAENGDKTTLKKSNKIWYITDPVSAPADETEVSGILTTLATVDIARTVEESPKDLKQFGLAEPRVDVGFKVAGGKAFQHLLIGDKTVTGGDLYAMKPGEKKVFLIAGSFDATFNRKTFDLRQKNVLAFERDKVDGLELQFGGSTVELERTGTDWVLLKPIQAQADFGTVEGIVGRVQTAQMQAIAAQDAPSLKAFGLDKPAVTVVVGRASTRATLLVGSKTEAGTFYAKDASRPMIFTVEASLVDDVKKTADQLRRKDIFTFRAFNATSIQIARGADTVAFEKVKGEGKDAVEKWRRSKPAVKDVDAAAMDTFLTKLANQRALSFVETGGLAKAKTGLESPVMVVVVRFEDGKKEETVRFGRVGSDVYAAIAGQPGAAKIDTTEFEDAVKALDSLK
jgi:hypothetical protein